MSDLEWLGAVVQASRKGRLMALLETVPPSRWTERSHDGKTLLHYACMGDNVAAARALLKHGLDVNAVNNAKRSPAHLAAFKGQSRVLEVLCAASADVMANDSYFNTPFALALVNLPRTAECIRLLLSNGVRIGTAGERYGLITPEMVALERGVLRCRSAVVTLLGLKRRRGDVMQNVDRWVVREIAWAVLATRRSAIWQQPFPREGLPPKLD